MKKNLLALAALLAGISGHAAGPRPNLLVLLTDDQRLNTIGAYDADCPIKTPNLDRLANNGIRFDNGFVTTPICVVSRASILTGRYACNARVHQFQTLMPADVFERSYNMLLQEAGYFTGQLGKYGVMLARQQEARFGFWDAQEGQGPKFRDYKGKKMHDSEWLTVKTEEFLDAVPKGKPFCLQVNYKAPHGSACPAPEDDHLLDGHVFARHPMDTPAENAKLPEFVRTSFLQTCYVQEFNGKTGDHNPFLRDYYEKIVGVERSVGKILEMLEKRGLAQNTVIVYLSDHGVHFGEKQLYGKWTPYEASLRIPFIVYDPRPQAVKKAVRSEMALNIDVAPTLLDLAGVPVPDDMDGRSLRPLIEGKKVPWRDRFCYEHFTSPAMVKYIPRNEGIRTATDKYVRWIDPQCGAEEFYDLARDPAEANNLINQPEYRQRIEAARREFAQWRTGNPPNYTYDIYEGRRPQALAPEIDWEKFAASRPEEYAKTKAQVERLGVTWKQAMDDWDVRFKICSQTGYWY